MEKNDDVRRHDICAIQTRSKPHRYSETMFSRNISILGSVEYGKWLSGVNPTTGRKLKIDGRTHRKVGQDMNFDTIHIFKNNINQKNWEDYNAETLLIYNEIERKNIEIKKQNIIIEDLNVKRRCLPKWDSYIVYNDVKYGVNHIVNDIHRFRDCLGSVKVTHTTTEECGKCDWGMWPCGHDCMWVKNHLKCDRCHMVMYSAK